MSDTFPIQNGLKQGRCFIAIAFRFSLGYAEQKRLKWSGHYQLLAYADGILLDENINAVKKT